MMILSLMKLVYDLFGYLIGFVWLLFYPKAILAAWLLAVQSQLAMRKNRIDLKKDSKSTPSALSTKEHTLFKVNSMAYSQTSPVAPNERTSNQRL